MQAFKRFKTPAICFRQIFLDDTGIMKIDTPVDNANPVKKVFINLLTNAIPTAIVGNDGAYVEAMTEKMVY